MSQTIKLEWDYMPPPQLRGNSRASWQEKLHIKNAYIDSAIIRLRQEDWEPMDKARITYHVYWCQKPIDRDNLHNGCKYLQDALVHEGLLKDDNPDILLDSTFEYTRVAKKKDVRFIMEIIEVEST